MSLWPIRSAARRRPLVSRRMRAIHLHVYDGRFDGLTLLGTSIGPQAIAPHLVKLPYDAVEAFAPVSAALPHVQSGRLRVLATTSSARLPALPTEPQAPDIIW